MKAGVVLLSLLAATATWWWITKGPNETGRKSALWLHGFIKSLAIGIGVYAVLTLSALVYLALTSR